MQIGSVQTCERFSKLAIEDVFKGGVGQKHLRGFVDIVLECVAALKVHTLPPARYPAAT